MFKFPRLGKNPGLIKPNDSELAKDYIGWHAHAHVDKWQPKTANDFVGDLGILEPKKADFFKYNVKPDLTADEPGNLLVTVGITRMLNLLVAAGATQAYDATHCRIGAGDTNTVAAAGNTDLAAAINASNRYFQLVDAIGSVTTNVLTLVATFASGNGNFAWAEWAIDQGTASAANAAVAPLLNRKVASLGTKVSGAVWAFTVTITVT